MFAITLDETLDLWSSVLYMKQIFELALAISIGIALAPYIADILGLVLFVSLVVYFYIRYAATRQSKP